MSSFLLRLSSLINLIKLKQKAHKVKQKTLRIILSNKNQIIQAKSKTFQFQSITQLFKALITINIKQLTAMLTISIISLGIQLFAANINSSIIKLFQKQQSISNLIICLLILILYKIIKSIIDQCSSYMQMNYGFLGYSALYYHFINSKKQMTGEVLNIIQDDMEKIANMPYSLINFPYLTILIFVLTALLASTLNQNQVILIFAIIILYAINTVAGVATFYLNQKVMKQKDYRLNLNLNQYRNPKNIQSARKLQVSLIRKFLMIKVIVKWLLQIFFVVFYGLIFMWKNQQTQSEDQLYYRLMLIGMLKIAFNSLYMQSYFLALVFNSLKRIIICQNKEQIQKSTIGCFEDFVKKNQKLSTKIQPTNQRQSTQSSLCSQASMTDSLLKQSMRFSKQQNSLEIKEIKRDKKRKQSKRKYRQYGQIKIFELIKYIKQNIHLVLSLSLLLIGLFVLYSKFQYLRISKSIIHNNMTAFQTFIFILPAVLYVLFYLVIILLFGQVSTNLFSNLNAKQIQGQDLNRISGDIQLVDKYVPPTFYQFFITVFTLLSSLFLTVSLIKNIYYAIITAILLIIIIFLAIYYNRYFMKSRRQLKRLQCRMKSKIIQTYADKITSHHQQQDKFDKVQKNWKKINLLKNIGILVQNSYILLLNLLVLIIQVLCFIICYVSSIDPQTSKLILVFIIQLDLSLTGLLLNTINLQLGLVNFQRCLNFVKRKSKLQECLKQQTS